ncbi:MAG: hypothetical protein JWN76_3441 [Chitinophagaceae bacterium]|nr:hypothetical protein [Chitinophagaceae bacterium]
MSPQRDLLVISRSTFDQLFEQELHALLYQTERIENFCIVTEIIDINRYKILHRPNDIRRVIAQRTTRPFVFVLNKN